MEPMEYGGYSWTSAQAFAAHMGMEALKLSLGNKTNVPPKDIIRWLRIVAKENAALRRCRT